VQVAGVVTADALIQACEEGGPAGPPPCSQTSSLLERPDEPLSVGVALGVAVAREGLADAHGGAVAHKRRVRSADSLSGIRLKLWSETPSGNCRFTARLSATSQHHHSGPAGLDSVDLVTSDRKPASSQRRFAIQVPELPRICPRLPGSENDQAKSPSGLSLPSRNSRPVHGDVEAREQVRSGRVDSSEFRFAARCGHESDAYVLLLEKALSSSTRIRARSPPMVRGRDRGTVATASSKAATAARVSTDATPATATTASVITNSIAFTTSPNPHHRGCSYRADRHAARRSGGARRARPPG
jgi:hypothetical protein